MPTKTDPISAEIIQKIATAVQGSELSDTAAWSDLDVLSSHTVVDAIEVFTDQIKKVDGKYQGAANVHCILQYDADDEAFNLYETFPGRFEVEIDKGIVRLTDFSVDTSSFYT